MFYVNGIKWSLDRLEFYIGDIPEELLSSLDYQEWEAESRSEWVRKYFHLGESFFVVKLNQNSYSNSYSGFSYRYKIRTNPADFTKSYKDYFLSLFGEEALEVSRLYRLDPSVCLKKSSVVNLETLRNCTFVSYQQNTEHYMYKETFRKGFIENFVIGRGSSRYIFYDLSLKYPVSNIKNHRILMRKTNSIDDNYICIEHQMRRNALEQLQLLSFKDLYKLAEIEVFKGINFLDTTDILSCLTGQRLMDPSQHYLALMVWRYGLHNARKNLNKQRNFSKKWGLKLNELQEANLGIGLKWFLQLNFTSSLRHYPDRLKLKGATSCNNTDKRRRDFPKRTWAEVNPFNDFYFNQNKYLNVSQE